MKQMWKKLTTVLLALVLALSVWPGELPGSRALAVGAYGKTTANGVRVRKQPSTGADYWFRLDMGYVCEVTDVTTKSGVTWYKVNVEHPDPGSDRHYVGYIHGDFFVPLTDEEAAAWEANPVQPGSSATPAPTATAAPTATEGTGGEATPAATASPTPAPTAKPGSGSTAANPGATGQISRGGVNFRETEGGNVIRKLDRGTVVELLTIPAVIDENHWYQIRYDGKVGYIQAPFITVVSTGDPSGATVPPGTHVSTYGYVKLILNSANLRLTPGGKVGERWENPGEVLEITGTPQELNGDMWYPVTYNGKAYFVHEECVQLQATPGVQPTAAPTATATPAGTIRGYVRTTAAGVNLRLKPAGEMIVQIKRGLVLPVLADVQTKEGYAWYYVQTEDGLRGYLRGDCVKVCNADGSDISGGGATPAPQPTATPGTTVYGYVKTVADKVNLRTKPTGASQEQIALNVVLPVTGPTVKSGKFDWYPVRAASGKTGYLRGDCVKPCSADGTLIGETPTATPAPTATPNPDATPTATPQATPAPTPGVSAHGYIQVTKTSVALRRTPGGAKVGTLAKSSVWPMSGNTTTVQGYTWYPVVVNGVAGYVRGDCCFKLSKTQEESYLAGNGVPKEETPANVNYVMTTLDKVNLRAAATKDSEAKFNVAQGTVMAYKTSSTVGGSLWYKVIYENSEVWVLGSCVKVMTAAEYEAWLATKPAATPQPEVILGYVKTTSDGVNLRATAGGSNIIGRVDKGVVMTYGSVVVKGSYQWYYVNSPKGHGYLRGDFLEECEKDGSALPKPSPTTTPGGSGQEATYTTLKKGSTGTAVKNLVTELKNQGYYTGEITSSYTSAVEAAVRAFQKANGLEADGIAGSKTQHKLFGTVEPGQGGTGDLTMTIYPAEKIDWYTGGIQTLWAKGANYKVYDVKTGIVWWAHRWSGGNHVDAEPLTAADTARLCKIYGVSTADEIASKDLWQRRPSLVTIGSRTFACSLYGVPHNYPDGDTIPTNNFKGQLCIHFTNSKTHDTNKVDSGHQKAIDYAYKNAPNGQK